MNAKTDIQKILEYGFTHQELNDWIQAFSQIESQMGPKAASHLVEMLNSRLLETGNQGISNIYTPFRNTIHVSDEVTYKGEPDLEKRIRHMVRWNALVTVLRANLNDDDLGGHISTFSSAATLYDVGFNHFFKGRTKDHLGDLIYFQGHSSPGVYARSFVEGRISSDQLLQFRREVDGKGLSSYPHPWLMPSYWQFPTVSMGLGPITAIYQAHVMKYQHLRKEVPLGNRKVWCFMGDGECDEPESLGALSKASRENLGHLIFVVNCNLQRLDGPVRGNGKIIQELEGVFRGAGWNVVKCVWGRHWDPLLAQDGNGQLQSIMDSVVDGELQNFKAKGGAYTREQFFNRTKETAAMVAGMTDDDIYKLNRGGHDPFKVYNAYNRAISLQNDKPTVILSLTTKGYGIGSREADNNTHQVKKLGLDTVKSFAERFDIPVKIDTLENLPFWKPEAGSVEADYLEGLREQRGDIPKRYHASPTVPAPTEKVYESLRQGSGEKSYSTTTALVRILGDLLRDQSTKRRVIPVVPDEARTFGLEGLFRSAGIYSAQGQLYEPEDAGQLVYYKESQDGTILEEGITEAGAISAWLAAATSYANHNHRLIPFYMFYSMFGFQRVMDLCWAAGDSRARGFLIGATAGRTTLNGEGLQHQDGQSHLMAAMVPNCRAYDPATAGELAMIVQQGVEEFCQEDGSHYYYITVYNERVQHQPLLPSNKEGVLRGMYVYQEEDRPDIHLFASGSSLPEVELAAKRLQAEFGLRIKIWSVTSYTELRREALAYEQAATFGQHSAGDLPWLLQTVSSIQTPVVAITDYMASLPDSIRKWMPTHYETLGTDGYGRSDSRPQLRRYFGVDAPNIIATVLRVLASQEGASDHKGQQLQDFVAANAEHFAVRGTNPTVQTNG